MFSTRKKIIEKLQDMEYNGLLTFHGVLLCLLQPVLADVKDMSTTPDLHEVCSSCASRVVSWGGFGGRKKSPQGVKVPISLPKTEDCTFPLKGFCIFVKSLVELSSTLQ